MTKLQTLRGIAEVLRADLRELAEDETAHPTAVAGALHAYRTALARYGRELENTFRSIRISEV